ncbi:hypothetical protein H4219_004193 [Mycoemilia scoparia]|uniref:Mediator of RNA polymerase II transcription subunit 20 n=1 Tax=Mycoemilia scoparia TaxID=417184 RepID=A0A9W7ZY46_9FUNG|nr:hypothetical protein H4219_004193 [Mycoemilia scoparia]
MAGLSGSTWVLRWADAEGTESMSYLQERLVSGFHAQLSDRWNVKTRLFRSTHDYATMNMDMSTSNDADQNQDKKSNEGPHRFLYLVNMSHIVPPRQFAVLTFPGPGGIWNQRVIESDVEIETIMSKMKNLWVPRQSAYIEGYSYNLGDFRVHLGTMRVGSGYKGIILQIDYLPCNSYIEVNGIMAEFVQMLLPPNARVDTNTGIKFEDANLSSNMMTDRHTALQYINLFTKLHLL